MTVQSEAARPPGRSISQVELISLLAMLAATVAFSIDAMLPALPAIGSDLSPADPKRAQLVIGAFVFGMGAGTLFAGPLSDAYGRRRIAAGGAAIYILGALAGAMAETMDQLLIARTVQGLGAAGPRIVSIALVRDLFSGRQMARITSFVMTVFTLVPVVAPSLGAALEWAFGWRAIFLSFAVFSIVSIGWLLLRQPETLLPERRRPFRMSKLAEGLREVFSNRQVVISICVQTLIFGMLFSALFSSQAIFDQALGKKDSFPFWFGVMAAISASSSILNAMFVVRFGMKNMVKWSLLSHALLTSIFLSAQLAIWSDVPPAFPVAFLWFTSVFFLAGVGIGNMNAIALEPMGHIAGMASSVISAVFTIASVFIAAPIGQMFDGTMVPLTGGILVLGCIAFGLVLLLKDSEGEIAAE